jgi:ABC-type uncharacterized transport system permease subunit
MKQLFKNVNPKDLATRLGFLLTLGMIGAILYYVFTDPDELTMTFTGILLILLAAGVTLMFGKWKSFNDLFNRGTKDTKIK